MKKGLIITGGIILVVVLSFVIFMGYLGMFSTLEPYEKVMGPYTFVYEDFTGPYKDTGPVFDKVYKGLEKDGIKTTRGIGIYYDNPSDVPAEKLRSKCGSIIEDDIDLKKLEKLKGKYKVMTIEKTQSVVVNFPIKNAMSYMVGPMKCYPALMKYSKEKKLEMKNHAYELYDMPEKITYYILPVVK